MKAIKQIIRLHKEDMLRQSEYIQSEFLRIGKKLDIGIGCHVPKSSPAPPNNNNKEE